SSAPASNCRTDAAAQKPGTRKIVVTAGADQRSADWNRGHTQDAYAACRQIQSAEDSGFAAADCQQGCPAEKAEDTASAEKTSASGAVLLSSLPAPPLSATSLPEPARTVAAIKKRGPKAPFFYSAFRIYGLQRSQCRIQCCGRTHGLGNQFQVRLVVTTDVHRFTLYSNQLFNNFRFVGGQCLCQRSKTFGQLCIFGLLGQRLSPVHAQIEGAATVVDAVYCAGRRLVIVQELGSGRVQCIRQHLRTRIACGLSQMLQRSSQSQELTE